MTNPVEPAMIEQIVGAKRDRHQHIARAVESEQRVYILHSQTCLDLTDAIDKTLAECPWSIALDRHGVWDGYRDQPVIVRLAAGRLIPTRAIEETQLPTGYTVRDGHIEKEN